MKVVLPYFFTLIYSVICPYPPGGDEVQMGSVLLPATRRGRYLANIVRRQAVDGTGIKFNKDADRMNADAKKKVDVLSEELLPYIIAEQERRTTLYKRVMTAIQNGEKGITIAEIRNKPPLLIKRGLMYRCPANRAPKEPDGTGILMCDENIEPTPVIYDSCLSAEDKDLYVGPDNKYFFCNRKQGEGPDLPRNGTSTIGCSPTERTSYNYTTTVCSLEDTDDVVVHYRYYPDRTYKYVTELDPDHEVCDHWNPCQIGYIYSLPGTDQALVTVDVYYYEKDEIVPQDFQTEYFPPNASEYTTSARKVAIPPGYNFSTVSLGNDARKNLGVFDFHFSFSSDFKSVIFRLMIRIGMLALDMPNTFFSVFTNDQGQQKKSKICSVERGTVNTGQIVKNVMPGRPLANTSLAYTCNGCTLQRILLRTLENAENPVSYVDTDRYQFRKMGVCFCSDKILMPKDFGDYFGIFKNKEGNEEQVKLLTINAPEEVFKTKPILKAVKPSDHYEENLDYECEGCSVLDLLCNGDSVMKEGRVTIVPEAQRLSFNFPKFENSHACVYLVIFQKEDGTTFRSTVATLEKVTIPTVLTVQAFEGSQFLLNVSFVCSDCTVSKVLVNGIELVTGKNVSDGISASYAVKDDKIEIELPEFSRMFDGTFQATFKVGDQEITKTLLNVASDMKKVDEGKEAVTEETTVTGEATVTEEATVTDETSVTEEIPDTKETNVTEDEETSSTSPSNGTSGHEPGEPSDISPPSPNVNGSEN